MMAFSSKQKPLTCPRLVAVGGLIASGKSTLSGHLGERLAAPVISSDRTRKQMANRSPMDFRQEPLWQGIYSPEQTEKVYAELMRQARVALDSGRSVILDASFRTEAYRNAAQKIALDSGVPFRFLECRVDPEICRSRLRQRESEPSISDAREALFEDFLQKWEPDESQENHVVVDTTRPFEETFDMLRPWLL